jgi:hypothetical protein
MTTIIAETGEIITAEDDGALTLAVDGFEFTPTGLVVTGEPAYDVWQGVGRKLQYAQRCIHWWIGDWLAYGERRYGETYAQAVEATGYAEQTLANDKFVASRVPSSRRREHLEFGHHAEVAALEPQAQDYWLQRAEAEHLTVHDLRAEIKAVRRSVLPAPQPAQVDIWADGEGVTFYALKAGDGTKRIEIAVEDAADGKKEPVDLHLYLTQAQARELALKIEAVTDK